jgi:hypothetical protein
VGKSARNQRKKAAMSRRQEVSGGNPPPRGVSAAKPTAHVAPAEPEQFPPKKLVTLPRIISIAALFGLADIAARWPGDGAPGLIFIIVAVYVPLLMWDVFAKLISVYGPVSIHNFYKVLFKFLSNYNIFLFAVFFLALTSALLLILRAPSLASSWGSLLPAHSRDLSLLEVSVLSGELAVMTFGGWLWFRRLSGRPSPRFGYRNIAEGLGDLAWTLAMISIAFGAAGSTSNMDWLVLTGVFVPVLANLRRQSYPDPRKVAAGSQR